MIEKYDELQPEAMVLGGKYFYLFQRITIETQQFIFAVSVSMCCSLAEFKLVKPLKEIYYQPSLITKDAHASIFIDQQLQRVCQHL